MSEDDRLFVGLTPLIQVFDMPTALGFYRDILNFHIVSASPEVETPEGRFSHWVWLRLGSVDLMLNTQYDSGERPPQADAARVLTHADTIFYIACADLDAAFVRISTKAVAKGVAVEPPRRAGYGLRLFDVKDPDGYSVLFQELPAAGVQ